jgi:hypothetical protein
MMNIKSGNRTGLEAYDPTSQTPRNAPSDRAEETQRAKTAQENSSRENYLLAIHTDQPAKPEYMSRARMRVEYHKIAAAPPIKYFSC